MRTLTDVLTEAKRLERYGAAEPEPYAAHLLAETCRILAAAADPDRLPYGERRVSTLVDDILAAVGAPTRAELVDLLAGK